MSRRSPPVVPGFRASGVLCGIKKNGLDLALLASDRPAAVAGVFTRSSVVGAPVELCRERVRSGRARGVVVNSGISNVAMGARGRRDARAMTELAGRALGCPAEQMLVASTGVIGEPLPMRRVQAGIARAAKELSTEGLPRAARAIMTTDTVPKLAQARARVGGRWIRVAGIAKGAGMVEPHVATMLAFLLTDAAATPAHLRRVLRQAADASFNRLTIDGETSTSDTVLLFANGAAGNDVLRGPGSPGARAFAAAVESVCGELTRALARDGEGATKLVTVRVRGARTRAEADRAARRIANSVLVKTALFGRDANWGRVLQAVGAGEVRVDLARTRVRLGGITVFRNGSSAGPAARRRARARLVRSEVEIEVELGVGRAEATMWTCDLSYGYVEINAEYTT
ncbi:MAG: bifunctional glutamate N-acetyltransferase/amino-acid acetyltransferase ArgJ [Deltaproteobacteria bacterium]|nr:MAG: bifunctional glutamate N-acetyltransferase/amino-acid acetyltransferase ArgJ [Deltaproteobacteria bacterium]